MARRRRRNPLDLIWGLGSLFFIALTFAVGGYYILIFMDPNSSLNIFPPSGQPISQNTPATETPTATLDPFATTATSDAVTPTSTEIVIIQEPTATATNPTLPTPTDFAVSGPTATKEPLGTPLYMVQEGSPVYQAYPDGCDGLYIAGNVFDKNGIPVVFMEIRLGGILNEEPLYEESAISGNAQQWGLSGYEIKITDTMVDSNGEAFVQMYDLETESPASEIIFLKTFNDCDQNLIILNFVQTDQE